VFHTAAATTAVAGVLRGVIALALVIIIVVASLLSAALGQAADVPAHATQAAGAVLVMFSADVGLCTVTAAFLVIVVAVPGERHLVVRARLERARVVPPRLEPRLMRCPKGTGCRRHRESR
jgi:hypothetical protein